MMRISHPLTEKGYNLLRYTEDCVKFDTQNLGDYFELFFFDEILNKPCTINK